MKKRKNIYLYDIVRESIISELSTSFTFPDDLKGITIFVGDLGSGKSLTATIGAYILYKKGFNIYSNYWLNFPHEPITCSDDIEKAEDGVLIIDEAYTVFDSRRSASKSNIINTAIVRKSRKKKIRVWVISQLYSMVDLRVRYLANYLVKPKIIKVEKNNEFKPRKLKVSVFKNSENRARFIKSFIINTSDELLNLYDTNADIYDFE